VVVLREGRERPPQVGLSEKHEVIQTFVVDRSDNRSAYALQLAARYPSATHDQRRATTGTTSAAMQRLMTLAARVALFDSTVLVTGGNGCQEGAAGSLASRRVAARLEDLHRHQLRRPA